MLAFCGNIFAPKKLQSQNLTRENLLKALSNEKFASKMLMKLTPERRTKLWFRPLLVCRH
jgi:hypothetical protein